MCFSAHFSEINVQKHKITEKLALLYSVSVDSGSTNTQQSIESSKGMFTVRR